jgi:hypothetical protein
MANIPPAVAAYRVLGLLVAIAKTATSRFGRASLNGLQLAPPSTVPNTPPPVVPTYRISELTGSMASAVIRAPVSLKPSRPLLTSDQIAPLSALERASNVFSQRVEDVCVCRIDSQKIDRRVHQSGAAPACAAIGAL